MNVVLLVMGVMLVGVQRLLELALSRRNERRLRARGAVERGGGHYPVIVAVHALWLVSTLVEGLLRGPEPPVWWPLPLAAFLLVQPLRYWAILSLGENWNTRVLVVPGAKLVRRGPYRYFPHQLRRRRCRNPDLPTNLRPLDNGGRLLAPERRPALRPHPNREPGAERSGRMI